ncbi:MAG: Tol-Pal system protein TolB [Betaproteobacteria bacterium]|nr:Tol-Pal system protein TolB [Betaproteobacteria bacterium]MDE2046899.1 Tol-Pal system protein TolB [Betaproteobacteria bacterium]
MRVCAAALFAALGVTLAQAQLRVEVTGVGAQQIPIAVATFLNQASSPQPVADIIRADLTRAGSFKAMPSGMASEATPPDFNQLKAQGADAYAAGSVTRLANGTFDVRFRVWDVVKGTELAAQAVNASPADLRMAAHRIADIIQEKLTGVRGAAASRIAYVLKNGTRFSLVVADSDGENSVEALISNQPIISPTWSPDGTELAYVSFESRKPVVYVQNLATRSRRAVANFKGINSAPAWSNDGRTLCVALSKDGLAQLYLIGVDGSGLRRLTNSSGIDTEPIFAPDGSLYFTSDRSGGPQIYRMSLTGGDAQRITFTGSYNVSPAISPDGKTLAYISRHNGAFKVYVQPVDGSTPGVPITDTLYDERPTFAPNGRLILYASRDGGREILASTTLDGRVKTKLTAPVGNIREPAWGPYLK